MVVFMPGLTVICIQNKWKSLRKDYKAVTILRNEGGVLWDPTLGTVIGADDGWWDTMVQRSEGAVRVASPQTSMYPKLTLLQPSKRSSPSFPGNNSPELTYCLGTGFPGGLDSIPSGDHGLDYLEGEDEGQEAAPVKEQHDPDQGSLSRPTDQKRLTEQSNLSRPTNQNRLTDQSSTDVLTDHEPSDIYASRSTSRSQTDQDQLKTRSERSGSVTTLFMEGSSATGFLP
ncbi:hypothetical protein CJ030_MR4G009211 [Morella rubra]|uniref:Myb/SANT-like domain-containing protein n=1 Tax=Morella rubra TaxID=262757 RepID=A0A6A1VUV0_9ROSI|nr:hypothetical protein CJ030_MR4G009211 [Morella rubra]